MLNRIKQTTGLLLIMFLSIVLIIAMLAIWDFVDNEIAEEMIIKTSLTFVVFYIISLIVIFITNKTSSEK